jgi:hypothetical protein
VGSTPQSAVPHCTTVAIQLEQDFLKQHTKVDIGLVTDLRDRLMNLEVDSRLEIVFKDKPKGLEVPSHSVFTHQSEYGLVIFEVETRVTARYILPGADFQILEIERKYFLNYYIDKSGSRRVSYTPTSVSGTLGRLA